MLEVQSFEYFLSPFLLVRFRIRIDTFQEVFRSHIDYNISRQKVDQTRLFVVNEIEFEISDGADVDPRCPVRAPNTIDFMNCGNFNEIHDYLLAMLLYSI